MDRANRSELVRTIEEQKVKLSKYEKKLRDLISAYRGLQKEKEALEASVNILSSTAKAAETDKGEADSSAAANDANQSYSDPLGAHKDDADSSASEDSQNDRTQNDIMKLKEQLATLTNSLATVMQEKSKMEANYQAENKKLRQDHESQVDRLEEENEQNQALMKDLHVQMQELKGKVIVQQHERDKEQTDHALMIRELQKLVSSERNAKEQLQIQLEETQVTLAEHQSIPTIDPSVSEEYQKHVASLTEQLRAVRKQLREAEERARQPSQREMELEKELAEMKAQQNILLQQEHIKTLEAKEEEQTKTKQGEQRVSTLEGRLSDLSQTVGNYERLRYQDQQVITRLRERVSQLDLENTALARAAHSGSETESVEDEADVQTLVDKITRLRGLLKAANEKSDKPINIDELLSLGESPALEPSSDIHAHCHEEYQALQEDFERYKLRAQSVLKNKSSKDTPIKELDTLKSQTVELREKLRELHLQRDNEETEHQRALQDMRKSMTAMQERKENEIAHLEAEHRQKITELEHQIHRHRDRTISLLAEKDRELESLRANSPERYENQYVSAYRQLSKESVDGADNDASGASSEETSAINELLAKSSTGTFTQADTSLLHFAQEQARKDVEIKSLRKQKLSLESTLRELQLSSSMKEEKLHEQIEDLKEEVRKQERYKSREGANMEYLKNVIYKYLVCNDWQGKQHMLNAIATILQFSPKERSQVTHVLKHSWWAAQKS